MAEEPDLVSAEVMFKLSLKPETRENMVGSRRLKLGGEK